MKRPAITLLLAPVLIAAGLLARLGTLLVGGFLDWLRLARQRFSSCVSPVLCLLCFFAANTSAGTFTAHWHFRDLASNGISLKQVTVQPIATYGVDGGQPSLITGDRRTAQSDSTGFLGMTNLFNGRSYRVTVRGPNFETTFTNSFDTNVTGVVNGADPLYVAAPLRDAATVAYSQAAADLRFLRTNIASLVRPGSNVTISTNGTGVSQYLTISSTGGGGGTLWESGTGIIYPSGGSGTESGWTSSGGSIYPD
jgi:hypothetical protein